MTAPPNPTPPEPSDSERRYTRKVFDWVLDLYKQMVGEVKEPLGIVNLAVSFILLLAFLVSLMAFAVGSVIQVDLEFSFLTIQVGSSDLSAGARTVVLFALFGLVTVPCLKSYGETN